MHILQQMLCVECQNSYILYVGLLIFDVGLLKIFNKIKGTITFKNTYIYILLKGFIEFANEDRVVRSKAPQQHEP